MVPDSPLSMRRRVGHTDIVIAIGFGIKKSPAPSGRVPIESRARIGLPDLGRVLQGASGNGLGTSRPTVAPEQESRHQYRRGCDASPIRMAAPFALGLARLWRAAIACRQRATRRSRVGTLPRTDAASEKCHPNFRPARKRLVAGAGVW